MADIKLNFINRSNDQNNSQIVIFQKNATTGLEETAVAWKVIQNCGQGWQHPFTYPIVHSAAVSDSWGNYSPLLEAPVGSQFTVMENPAGDILQQTGQAANPIEVEVLNGLSQGAINANIYRDGRLLATKTSIAPGQKAAFQFKPTLWIGVVSQVEEGAVINSAILSQVNTEISLEGVQSANIVMTGGGPGPAGMSFSFSLENIKY